MAEESTKVEMTERWTLIQRASEKVGPNEHRTGVDKLLDLDYMGSSEFEFGSVSNSIKMYRALANEGKLVISKSGHRTKDNKSWFMLHHVDFDKLDVERQIIAVSTGKSYVKESTYFDYWLPNSRSWWSKAPATVWIVLPHDGHQVRSSNFVIWGISHATIKAIHAELCKPTPTPKGVSSEVLPETPVDGVSAEDLRVFDTVSVKLRTGVQTPATIVGIHERCVDVKLPDGSRLKGIPYSSITLNQ